MPRALLIVLDSVGCGGAPDAAHYGDEGSSTLGHIAQACAKGNADRAGLRAGPLHIPHLNALGLGNVLAGTMQPLPAGLSRIEQPAAHFGRAAERSHGKDTPSGHWEITGAPFEGVLGTFPDFAQCFPADLVSALIHEAGLPGVLGECHAAGVEIVERLGAEHVQTGKPIIYTSADSVFQIAAHEQSFGLERLYETCRIARRLVDPLNIGRVIARPFVGDVHNGFVRTAHRQDFPIPPPPGNLLDAAAHAQRDILTLGKIGDIFRHRATGREIKGDDNAALLDVLAAHWPRLCDGGLAFVNLVDFDTDFGHRRDVAGYAHALELFDAWLPAIHAMLRPGDLCILTADHGNDPTWPGTEHTRECVPVLCFGPGIGAHDIGMRQSFADIGQTVAAHLNLPALPRGQAWRLSA